MGGRGACSGGEEGTGRGLVDIIFIRHCHSLSFVLSFFLYLFIYLLIMSQRRQPHNSLPQTGLHKFGKGLNLNLEDRRFFHGCQYL